ncbi:MAG: hypothetical protein H7841_13715 [Magnetospirillum sp. WYHS-4]
MAVYLGLTVLLMGFAAWMMGQAVAESWRPVWQVPAYALALGVGDRFLAFALFEEPLLSLPAYALDTATLLALGILSFRLARVRKMVSQYPWLYEAAGPFWWRDRI